MPRTKGSKNKPKAINDYTSQITEKQETIASLNTEIVSIQKAIEEQKNTLKEKKIALKKAEKEVASMEAKISSWFQMYPLVIIPGLFEPPVQTLRAAIPENKSHIFR